MRRGYRYPRTISSCDLMVNRVECIPESRSAHRVRRLDWQAESPSTRCLPRCRDQGWTPFLNVTWHWRKTFKKTSTTVQSVALWLHLLTCIRHHDDRLLAIPFVHWQDTVFANLNHLNIDLQAKRLQRGAVPSNRTADSVLILNRIVTVDRAASRLMLRP